jgi:anti-anti-sigma factor
MHLTMRTDVVDTIPVVSVHGEVDLGTVPQLRDGLHRELDEHPGRGLVVDLDAVTVFDDVGLGILLGLRRSARARGTEVALVASSPRLRALLSETGLDAVLPPAASVTEAVHDLVRR